MSSLNQQKYSQNTAIESGFEDTIQSGDFQNFTPFPKNNVNASNMSSFDNSKLI